MAACCRFRRETCSAGTSSRQLDKTVLGRRWLGSGESGWRWTGRRPAEGVRSCSCEVAVGEERGGEEGQTPKYWKPERMQSESSIKSNKNKNKNSYRQSTDRESGSRSGCGFGCR